MLVFIDVDSSETLTENDIVLKSDGTVVTAPETPDEENYFATINSYDSDAFDQVIVSMDPAVQRDVYFKWRIPAVEDNTIQGDSVSFDVTFTLEQADVD